MLETEFTSTDGADGRRQARQAPDSAPN
jgi:hypothetical protein